MLVDNNIYNSGVIAISADVYCNRCLFICSAGLRVFAVMRTLHFNGRYLTKVQFVRRFVAVEWCAMFSLILVQCRCALFENDLFHMFPQCFSGLCGIL